MDPGLRRDDDRCGAVQLSPAGGVRLAGIDVSRPLSPAAKEAIDAAFLAHHVVVFPDQSLSREQQFAFAANFGEVEAHGVHRPGAESKRYAVAHVMSNLGADGRPTARLSRAANYHWHTDKPYRAGAAVVDDALRGRTAAQGRRHRVRQHDAGL